MPPRSSSPFSSSSTVDEGESSSSSPVIPALRAPQLPARALEYLRATTPSLGDPDEENQYVTASWGSPYQQSDGNHIRQQSSSSSELSEEESPLHQLEINTPFLRPAPPVSASDPEPYQHSLSGSAAILANRARRPVRGLTEDWIRQHTTKHLASEHRHWLSDGTDESEHSSLSGSASSDEAGWFAEADPRTPRASARPVRVPNQSVPRHPRTRSSNETLKQAVINIRKMESLVIDRTSQYASSIHTTESSDVTAGRMESPVESDQNGLKGLKGVNGSAHPPITSVPGLQRPATPPKPTKMIFTQTPRLKKKVPWRGKNIMVLLPRDAERGQPGKAPIPLRETEVKNMLRSWTQLGYNIRGFDLNGGYSQDVQDEYSRSRGQWPDLDDVAQERSQRKYQVTLPDLNGMFL